MRDAVAKVKLSFVQGLVLALSLQISGVAVILPKVWAASRVAELHQIDKDSRQLLVKSAALMPKAQYPETLETGKVDRKKLRQDVSALAESLKIWKAQVERALEYRPSEFAGTEFSNPDKLSDWKIARMLEYFNLLVPTIKLHSYPSVGAPLISGWSGQTETWLGLKVPFWYFMHISGAAAYHETFAKKVLNREDTMLQLDVASYDAAKRAGGGHVILELGQKFAQMLDAQARASQPSEEAALKTYKYVAALQLYASLENLNTLRAKPKSLPAPPAELRAELGNLANLDQRFHEDREQGGIPNWEAEEKAFRQTLLQNLSKLSPVFPAATVPELAKQFNESKDYPPVIQAALKRARTEMAGLGLEFIDDLFIEDVLRVVKPELDPMDPEHAKKIARLVEACRIIEMVSFHPYFKAALDRETGYLSTLPADQRLEKLKAIFVTAKLSAFENVTLQGAWGNFIGRPDSKTPEGKELDTLLDERATTFASEIETQVIAHWIALAEAKQKAVAEAMPVKAAAERKSERKAKVKELIRQSWTIAMRTHDVDQAVARVATLHKTLSSDYGSLGLTSMGVDLMDVLTEAKSYSHAYDAFHDALAKAKAKASKDPTIAQDVRGLQAVAPLFGFDRKIKVAPLVSELKLSKEQKARYFVHLYRDFDHSGLLNLKLRDGRVFYAAMNDAQTKGAKAEEATERVLEEGLNQLEANIVARIHDVAKSKDKVEFFNLLLQSPVLHQYVEAQFPSLISFQRHALARATQSKSTLSLYEHFSQAYMMSMPLFLGLTGMRILSQTLLNPGRWVVKFSTELERSAMVGSQGFLNMSLIAMAYDMVHLHHKMGEESHFRETMEKYTATDVGQASFFTYFQLMEAQDREEAMKASFNWMVASQFVFLGAPIFANEIKRNFFIRGATAWREYQFSRIGINAKIESESASSIKNSIWSEARINQAAHAKSAAIEARAQGGKLSYMDHYLLWEIDRHRSSLLRLVANHRRLADTMGKHTYRYEFKALGFEEGKYTLDLEQIENALIRRLNAHHEGRITAAEAQQAERAAQSILQAIRSQYAFSEPGPLRTALLGSIKKPSAGSRWARLSLLDTIHQAPNTEFHFKLRERVFERASSGSGAPGADEAPSEGQIDLALETLGVDRKEFWKLYFDKNTKDEAFILVKKAHRKMTPKYHPDSADLANLGMSREEAELKFKDIQSAYDEIQKWKKFSVK